LPICSECGNVRDALAVFRESLADDESIGPRTPRETRADRGTGVAPAKCESHARDFLHQGGTIDDADLKLLLVTDNIGDALEHIRTHAVEQFRLVERRMTPSRVLGERAA
jgi:hypothetical protein